MKIAKQLKNPNFRFVKIRNKSKAPFEKDWQNTANYSYDDSEFIDWIEKGNNYGVLGGFGNLVIIDCDKKEIEEIVEKELPKTFSVKTGRGGRHFYFICQDLNAPIRLREKSSTKIGDIGDIQSKGKQVVGAGSTHPSGNKYKVETDFEIAEISAEQIRFVLKDYINSRNQEQVKDEEKHIEKNEGIELNIEDVCSTAGMIQHGSEYQGSHPVHGSDTKSNFCINPSKNTWHCFRHDTGGGAISLFAVMDGIIDCSEATAGCLRGEKFKEVLKRLREKGLIKEKQYTNTNNLNLENEIFMLIINKKEEDASELITNKILEEEYIYTTREDTKPEIWFYENGIYKPNGKSRIEEICRKILKKAYTPIRLKKVLAKIEADTKIEVDEFFNDENLEEIPVQNGILNLKTKELSEFTPEKIFFGKLPVEYNSNAKCPNIEKFLTDIFDKENLDFIYEKIGYCLWKEHFIEKATMLVGDGRNGKSKFLALIKNFLGHENCCSVSLSQLVPESTSVSELHKKLVNLAGDLSNDSLKNTGLFKEIIGRDIVGAKRKYLNDLFFINYAKMFFACNELPRVYDMSFGFWGRWDLIELKHTFVKKEKYEELESKKGFKIADADIIKNIISEEELSGLLNKSLEGLHRILKNKDFSNTKSVEETKNTWVRKANSVVAFCMDFIEAGDETNYIEKAEFRRKYSKYCREHKVKAVTDKSIKYVLETQYGVTENQLHSENKGHIRIWEGIKFKDLKNTKNTMVSPKVNYTEKITIFGKNHGNAGKIKNEKKLNSLLLREKLLTCFENAEKVNSTRNVHLFTKQQLIDEFGGEIEEILKLLVKDGKIAEFKKNKFGLVK